MNHDINTSTIGSEVLHLAKDGDDDAWRVLACRYAPLVFRWMRYAGITSQDAVDLTQDVFVQTLRHLPTFSRNRSHGQSLSAWLYTVTRNRVADHFRHKTQMCCRQVSREALESFGDENSIDSNESNDMLDNRMARFCQALDSVRSDVDARTWTAFWRLSVDGDSMAEIAADLGISVGAVRQAKYRVIRKLRDENVHLTGLPTHSQFADVGSQK